MSWTNFWELSTITFFGGMAIGAWLGPRRHRIPPVPTLANATPPTMAELHAGVFTQSDDDDEPRPIQVGDKVTLYPIIGGYDAVRAMFDPHNPPPGPLDAGMTTAEALEGATRMGEAIRDATLVIRFDNASGTFTPTGPRHEFGEENAATLQEAVDAGRSLAEVHEQLYGGQDASPQ